MVSSCYFPKLNHLCWQSSLKNRFPMFVWAKLFLSQVYYAMRLMSCCVEDTLYLSATSLLTTFFCCKCNLAKWFHLPEWLSPFSTSFCENGAVCFTAFGFGYRYHSCSPLARILSTCECCTYQSWLRYLYSQVSLNWAALVTCDFCNQLSYLYPTT